MEKYIDSVYTSFDNLLTESRFPVLYGYFQSNAVKRTYRSGEQIVYQNEVLDSMGLILSGEAEIEIISSAGEMLIAEKFPTGSLISAVAFLDGCTSPAAVIAVSDCVISYIPYKKIRSDVELNEEATLIAGRCAASLYRIAERLLTTSLLLSLPERILMRLRRLQDDDGNIEITVEKLASYLAVNKHRVHRALKTLEEEGNIDNSYGSVTLLK